MSFTPKFADMVRNSTSVQGTGNVVLGAAPAGFTGFAQACAAGDQFYYCIQGSDKPAEREVGKGTMLADGSIAREALDGAALTKFTGGAKTISLVAAAEWFARVGGAQAGPTVRPVALRAELATLTGEAGQVCYLAEARAEGLFAFEAGDLSARVAADPGQAVHVAPANAPTGASGAWVRQREDEHLRPEWFGAVPDGVSDCTDAFEAMRALGVAMARGGSMSLQAGPQIRLAAKTYFLTRSFDCKGFTANWRGAGGGYDYWSNSGSTTIRMGPGATWYFQAGNTEGAGSGTTIPWTCAGSVFENITWCGPGKGVGSADLATMRATVTLMNCRFIEAGNHGLVIRGTIGGGGAAEGNVNCWSMIGGACSLNGGSGLFVEGGDSNAGTCSAVSFNANDRYGTEEQSFLGNDYYGCHWNANALGHIHSTNPNSTNKFFGYWESGYPISTVSPRSIAMGTNSGSQIAGASIGANDAIGDGRGIPAMSGLQVHRSGPTKTFNSVTGARPEDYPGEEWYHSDFNGGTSALVRRFRPGTGIYVWELGTGSTNYLLSINGHSGVRYLHGLQNAPSGAVSLSALYLGDGNYPEGRRMVGGSAAPTSGEHARGEIVFNRDAAIGAPMGWMCVAPGTPGTWAAMPSLAG